MTRDELLDKAVGKCVPVPTGSWGLCQTHNVGWAPAAFEDGRCWHVAGEVKAVEIALFFVAIEVQALKNKPLASFDGYTGLQALREVLSLPVLDGGVNPPHPVFGHDHGQ